MEYGIPLVLLYLYQQVPKDLDYKKKNLLLEKEKTRNIVGIKVFKKNESQLKFVIINS
jgi:hypothetical protein